MRWASALVALGALLLLPACEEGTAGGEAAGGGTAGQGRVQVPASPSLGGPTEALTPPPEEAMGRLEAAVARRLDSGLADDGLDLQHVDCPAWTGAVPMHLTCDAYVDGVLARVEVDLSEGSEDAVEFEAVLGDGIVATARLVDRLLAQGYAEARCGPAPAYPARPGLDIVCQVRKGGTVSHVVATVADRSGSVRIVDY